MKNFSKTIIYKIINFDFPDLIYIGSTTNFNNRRSAHKSHTKLSKSKLYETIRTHGGWESWKMIKICNYPCTSSI